MCVCEFIQVNSIHQWFKRIIEDESYFFYVHNFILCEIYNRGEGGRKQYISSSKLRQPITLDDLSGAVMMRIQSLPPS